MTIRLPYQDPDSERLLLVVLEDPAQYSREYRHIRATVIRRAVPHKLRKDAPAIYDGTGVEVWNDEHATNCTGYRVASYVKQKHGVCLYVDDMQLRGQIDVCQNPLNKGRPYSTKVEFKPHSVCKDSAKSIFEFFRKMEIFKNRFTLKCHEDNFYVELNHLAQFLKITKVAFHKVGVRHCSLAEANCFDELDIALCGWRIDEMLAPFYKE